MSRQAGPPGSFFYDSPELLMLSLVEGKKIDAKELARLRKRPGYRAALR